MKKNLKKISVSLLSSIIVQTCCFIPLVSATEAKVYIDAGFDDKAIGQTFTGNTVWTDDNTTAKTLYVSGNKDETQGTDTGVISVVADPKDETGANKVIMVDTHKRTSNTTFYAYARRNAGIQIMQSKIMITNKLSKDGEWRVHEEGPLSLYLYSTDAGVKIGTSTSNTFYTMNYNEWYDLKCVYDMTAVLYDGNGNPITTSSGTKRADPKKAEVTYYVNNIPIHTKSLSSVATDADGFFQKDICPAIAAGVGKDDKTKVYVDDFMLYYAPANSELEIENYDEMNNSVYMAGTKLKLQAESIIGKDYGVPFDKIEWYCDGERIGTGESVEYTTTVGNHTIYAAGYISADDENEPALKSSYLTITVEPGFTEEVLMDEDFEEYTDGTTNWFESGSASNKWIAPVDAKAITVDAFHNKSINSGTTSGRTVKANIGISNGTVKISGEYYFNTLKSKTIMGILNNGTKDINHLAIHSKILRDIVNDNNMTGDNTQLATIAKQRWYKVDLVLTFKDGGQGYYNIYIDGKRLTQGAYAYNKGEFTSVASTNNVTFLSANNDAEIYLDNLKISKISYAESTDFYDGENEIDTLSEVTGDTLTAKTLSAGGPDCSQYLAIYDNTTDRLLNVVQGTYDNETSIFTATCDISQYDGFYAKTFLWNEMTPVNTPGVIR